MMIRPRLMISVIMPVYNCERYVEDAVGSILCQSYRDFEFLIIDDASTDNTVSIITKFNDSRIQLINKPKNTGYTNSLNYALSIAKGKYIARMDGDDVSLPERFAKQIYFLESHPKVVVCGTNYSFLGSNKQIIQPKTHEAIKIVLLEETCFGHPTVMMRKSVLDKYNLQYEIEKEPAEDYALWVTLLNYGKLHNLQEVLLNYRVYEGQVSQKRRDVQLQSKLSTRLKLLQYLGLKFSENDFKMLKKILSNQTPDFEELCGFVKIKKLLLEANFTINFFGINEFDNYLNTLERSTVIKYFLKRHKFTPKNYGEYLKIKKELHVKLPLKTDVIVLIKSLFFYRTKKYSL